MPRTQALRMSDVQGRVDDPAGAPCGLKLTVYLSREAADNLEQLGFKLLDRKGNKPTGSQIIEALLRTALKNEQIPAYPVQRRS
jgi:hypothetical protein